MKRDTENAIVAEMLVRIILFAGMKRPSKQAKRNLILAVRKGVRQAAQLALKTSAETN